ncbi:hypothetical protein C8D92_105192 [Tamilnaduibacter salinus]|uniref:Uncharacterized protein n=1 Tax=Tamilnaduibacter salinus TaxID=1484056 RepID=A0A2U1CWR7_9GAMM|nr:hypothetical protein [Tamilnaduibacter salinus]PVY76439.1 hypothetical protein C8D92_105192 [Tamilnaduibacter salinus]
MRRCQALLLLPLLGLGLAFVATAQSEGLRIVYQNYDFYVPEKPVLMAYLGTDSDILIAKYSEKPGKKFIGFSRERDLNTGECPPAAFFEQALEKRNGACREGSLKAFRTVFMKDRDSGRWSGEGHQFYYFVSPEQSTVFIISDKKNEAVYKVESDYLDKDAIKAIFSEYL